MKPYRILVAAPYEGFRGYFVNAVKNREDIQADIYPASLYEATALVQSLDMSQYEVIISRGRSGKIIQDAVDLPVVNVDFSTFDILRGLELALLNPKKTAFVSFFELGNTIPTLCKLLNYNTQPLVPATPTSSNEMEQTILNLYEKEGVELFIGDGACVHCAKAIGAESILITSGPESLENAINRAIEICEIKRKLINENSFYKSVLKQTSLSFIIYDEHKNIVHSNLFNKHLYSSFLYDTLTSHIAKVIQYGQIRWMINDDSASWKVQGELIQHDQKRYILYHITDSLPLMSKDKYCLEIVQSSYIKQCYQLVISNPVLLDNWKKALDIKDSYTPILIHGPIGIGKKTFACALYSASRFNSNPLLAIDCRFIDEKYMIKLFEDERSPLIEKNYTILFKDIDTLSLLLQNKLAHNIKCIELTERAKIIATLNGNPNEMLYNNSLSKELCYILTGFSIQLPALYEAPQQLATIARTYLNELNQQLPVQLVGFEPGALQMLENFHWEYGISQFKMVLKQLSAFAEDPFICKNDVEKILNKIQMESSKSDHSTNSTISLDGTLDEILTNVIRKVLEEEGMNQSKAAKRLNISRGMLWKRLKEQE